VIRSPADGANPAAALASVNSPTPSTNTSRRPRASPNRPAGTRTRPKVSAYPDTIHCRSLSEAPKLVRMVGNATLTMLTSSSDMKPATKQTDNARQRRGSVPGCSTC